MYAEYTQLQLTFLALHSWVLRVFLSGLSQYFWPWQENYLLCDHVGFFFYNEIPTPDSSSFAAWYYTLPVRIFFSGRNFWSTWKKTPTWRIFFTRFPKLKQLGSSMTIIKKLDMCKILDKCKINHCSVHVYDAYSTILHIIWPRDV